MDRKTQNYYLVIAMIVIVAYVALNHFHPVEYPSFDPLTPMASLGR